MTFEEKVKSMTSKEIILALVDGVRNPIYSIKMSTYGDFQNGKCIACAATNCISKISGVTFDKTNIMDGGTRCIALKCEYSFLDNFEDALDYLRRGMVDEYNKIAIKQRFAEIKEIYTIDLPELEDNFIKEELQPYIDLANAQKQ